MLLACGCDLIVYPKIGDRERTGIQFLHSLPNEHFVNERLTAVLENSLNLFHYGFG